MAQNKTEAKLQKATGKVLTNNCADLSSLMEVVSPPSVGQKLVAAGIVATDAFRNLQHLDPPTLASRLFFCIEPVLKLDSNKFHKFLSILLSYEPCVKVVSKMCEELKEGELARNNVIVDLFVAWFRGLYIPYFHK